MPVGPEGGSQELRVIDKGADGRVTERTAMGVIYVPLTDAETIRTTLLADFEAYLVAHDDRVAEAVLQAADQTRRLLVRVPARACRAASSCIVPGRRP